MVTSLLPNPLFDYGRLFNLLLPVTSLLVAASLLSVFQRAATVPDKLRGLGRVTAIVALLANFDLAVQSAKGTVHSLVQDELRASPEQVLQKFAAKLMATEQEPDKGLFSRLTHAGTHFFHGLMAAFIAVIALLAMVFLFLAYLAQELALELGVAFAPLLIGLLLLSSTRGIGVQFLLYMLAIVLFPLGWGAASLVSDQLIEFAVAQDLGSAAAPDSGLSFAMRNLFGALLLAVWMILSTIYAPYALLLGVTRGVHLTADAVQGAQAAIRSIRS